MGTRFRPAHDPYVNKEESGNANSRDHQHVRDTSVQCAECKISSGLYWQGWRAYRTDDPELGEPPAVAFYCPTCATREFG